MNIQISQNFWLDEFTWSSVAHHRATPTPIQLWLLKQLVINRLQKGRNKFGKFTITSGLRNHKIWDALYRFGYSPSKTTDHSFGNPMVYQFGVGAVDFIPKESELWDVFQWYVSQSKSHTMEIGQVIIYPEKGFIHLSNPKELVYSPKFTEQLQTKQKYLIKRGGKYHTYLP